MKLANLKLGVRLGIAFTVIIALMIAIISIAVVMLAKLNVASVQGCCVEECPPQNVDLLYDSLIRPMPINNKNNAAIRHPIPKMKFKVENWAEQEAGLRRRDSLTLWVTDEAVPNWQAAPDRGLHGIHVQAPERDRFRA